MFKLIMKTTIMEVEVLELTKIRSSSLVKYQVQKSAQVQNKTINLFK